MVRTFRIAAVPGDGIGSEVIAAGLEVLAATAARDGKFAVEVETLPWGADYYRDHRVMMPDDGIDQLRLFDAILFRFSGRSPSSRPRYPLGLAAPDMPVLGSVRQRPPSTPASGN